MSDPKARAQAQWTADPCGSETGAEREFGTREFFDEVERYRYKEYAPWMPEVMGFNQFPGAKLLEVGCGMGTDLLQFARGRAHCTGIDLTPRSIEISRHRFSLYGEPANFLRGDAERLPFADNSFDVVYSNGVLHHTPETAKAINELHRVVRPGGLVRVMLYHRHSLNYWGQIIVRYGLLRGQLLRGETVGAIMGRVVEYSSSGNTPLVKVYSRREVRELFGKFVEVDVKVRQLMRQEFSVLSPLVPEGLLDRLGQTIGWNVIVSAKKR
jgi:ubiquinone/menaquinone biosynthesis C-methylase UbiE